MSPKDVNADKNTSKKGKSLLSWEIGAKEARKLKAQQNVSQGIWSSLGLFGLVGWSVAVPTLIGAALGYWLDKHYPGSQSRTLALLVAGLTIGCWNAWYWVTKEQQAIHKEQKSNRKKNDDGKR